MTGKNKPSASFLQRLGQEGPLQARCALVVVGGFFLLLCARYLPFLSDDALVALRYARRFATGSGLTWSEGQRVEGYSDLLWVLLHVPFAWLDLDLVAVARGLGLIGASLGLVALALDPLSLKLHLGRLLGGAGFLALLVPYAVWATGGLEHGFMAGLICVSLVQAERLLLVHREGSAFESTRWITSPWAWVGSLVALTWLRLDGILIAGLMALGVAFAGWPRWAAVVWSLRGAAAASAAALLQLLFRVLYYGDWVPPSARARVSLEVVRWEQGLVYLREGLGASAVGVAVACVALILGGSRGVRRSLPALVLALGWLGYQVFVGGDTLPAYRQLLFGLVPLAHVLSVGLASLYELRLSMGKVLGGLTLVGLHLSIQVGDLQNKRASSGLLEAAGSSIGPVLGQAFREKKPLLGVDAAGALPYWSDLPSLDLLGVNDRYLATHRPKDFGRGVLGYELGEANYYLKREVDLFAFCGALGSEEPCFPPSQEMVRRPGFRKYYRLVRLQGLPPERADGAVYVRIFGNLGYQRTKERMVIPGYFLASRESSVRATLEGGKLGTTLRVGELGIVEGISLWPGTYRVETGSDLVRLGMRCRGRMAERVSQAPVIEVAGRKLFDLFVAHDHASGRSRVEEITLRKVDEAPGLRCTRDQQPVVDGSLLGPPLSGAEWRAPPALLVPSQGHLRIVLKNRPGARAIEVAAGHDDELRVRLVSGEQLSPWVQVPAVAGTGMRLRTVELPPGVPQTDEVEVQIAQVGGVSEASVRYVGFK